MTDHVRIDNDRWERMGLIGTAPIMLEVRERIERFSPSGANVLILGERGTGKELAARAVHALSCRSEKPFVPVNCAALPENLLESELFGHEKGAFTNAHGTRIGRLEQADGGTLFLDEIGNMSPAFQEKILRVVEYQEFERVGGMRTIRVDVRIISATNAELDEATDQRRFRSDLLDRLNVLMVEMPPLRERGEDLALLARHFVREFARREGRALTDLEDGARAKLRGHSWPGNVRELRNVIERAVALMDRESSEVLLQAEHIEIRPARGTSISSADSAKLPLQCAEAIADMTLDSLLQDHLPLEGLLRGSKELGGLAECVVEGVAVGFERYLETEDGRRALGNLSDRHLLAKVGGGTRSANVALWRGRLLEEAKGVLQRAKESL